MILRKLRHAAPAAATLAVVLLAWWWVTAVGAVPRYVIPAPADVLRSFMTTWSDRLGPATAVTAVETLAGLAVGILVALAVVILAGHLPVIGQAMTPLLVGSQAVPVIVIGPLLTIVFGYGMTPKVIVVALLCFFPVALNLIAGIQAVDPRLIDTLRTVHAGRVALFWRVRLPFAAPRGFAGLRISVTFAPVAAVFAEYTGSTDGLGFLMLQAIPRLQTEFVFAQVLVLTALSGLLLASVMVLERFACPWANPRRRSRSTP